MSEQASKSKKSQKVRRTTADEASGDSKISIPPTKDDEPLFPVASGKTRPNYGTNNTLELLERIPSEMVDLKLDDVLTAVKTVDNLCDYPKCKARTSLMGQDCELCRKRFCFKHGLPEVHGCGEAVKKDERKKFLEPQTGKTLRQEKELEQAKKKLQTKLKDMQGSRMQKPSGAKNKKK